MLAWHFFMHIVCAKYQKGSVKALVQIDFPTYALSMHFSYKSLIISSHFAETIFFFLHDNSSCTCTICTVYEMYQKVSVKALVQVDFPVYALPKHRQNKQMGNKPLLRSKVLKTMAKFKTLSFCQKVFYCIKLIHASVQYVYIVYAKYQMASEKALAQVDFHVHALSER